MSHWQEIFSEDIQDNWLADKDLFPAHGESFGKYLRSVNAELNPNLSSEPQCSGEPFLVKVISLFVGKDALIFTQLPVIVKEEDWGHTGQDVTVLSNMESQKW